MKLLNIGCGSHYHPSWTNIDMSSSSPDIIECDIRNGLLFSKETFDAVYHSHIVEHLNPRDALVFMKEVIRVLKPRGIMRVAVPDLEKIVRVYLEKLEASLKNVSGAEEDYDWMVLELLDQMVRDKAGGDILNYWRTSHLSNKDFIRSRVGREAVDVWAGNRLQKKRSLWQKMRSMNVSFLFQTMRNVVAEQCVSLIAGNKAKKAFQEGLFRISGEVHQWMYDRYSLKRLMLKAGFTDVAPCLAEESRIEHFNTYNLDVVRGEIRKPDSLFMEGCRP